MAKILAVDDDKAILTMIRRILEKDGHRVTVYADSGAVEQMELSGFDLILLDVMMPGTDGFTLCEKLRCRVDCPILFLTARSEESSLVFGLEKVAAHLRRERREHFSGISFEKARFNFSSKQLLVEESVMPLTRAEYAICEFLARNHGQVFSKEQIYEKVFGFDGESDEATIATHIKNIRGKLEKYDYAPIKTVWGIGYKWDV